MAKGDKLIVAAIDFGTTYSGFAYCSRHDYEEYLKNKLKNKPNDYPPIKCHTWSEGSYMNHKAPTCALFDPNKQFHSFGYEARQHYHENLEKEDLKKWYYFEHFKMMLYKEKDELTQDTWLKESIDLTGHNQKMMKAIDVFAAVLGYFRGMILNALMKGHGENVFSNDDIHWVLTVPAIWDLKAKQFMRDAAERAKISNDQLTLALEPEAASIHCRRQPIGIETQGDGSKTIDGMKKGDKYVVFDQGGGTTDITVHEVIGPNSLKEIHQACGGYWGGTIVNGEFYKFLVRLLGGNVINAVKEHHPAEYFELMHNFELSKKNFKGDSSQVTVRLPIQWVDTYKEITEDKLEDIIPQTNFNNKIKLLRDKLRISPDLFRSFFDYSIINAIEELERLFLKEELSDVHTLLAVGGFSESSVLIDAIKEKLGSNIDVIVPRDPGLAVLKGAVLYGFEPEVITSRVSRYTYGVAMQRKYIQGLDAASCSRRGNFVDDVFDIHVRKGQVVEIGHFEPEHIYFPMLNEQKCAHFEFFATEDIDPRYTTDNGCKMIGVLSVDLARKSSKDGELSLKINASGTEIVAIVTEKSTTNEHRAYFNLF